MDKQTAYSYLNSLTRFVFEKDVYDRIAAEQGLLDDAYASISDIPEQVKDFCLIALYEVIVNGSPWSVASNSVSHGSFTHTVGTETITAAAMERIMRALRRLYKKYGMDDLADEMDSGGTIWVNEYD